MPKVKCTKYCAFNLQPFTFEKELIYFFFLCLFFLSLFLRLCVDILCLFLFFPLGIVYKNLCY